MSFGFLKTGQYQSLVLKRPRISTMFAADNNVQISGRRAA
jgi:hypothetical protein